MILEVTEMASITMDDIRRATAEFRGMATMADALEDAGDDGGALAVRVALHDRMMDTVRRIDAEVEELQMTRTASDGMEREAAAPVWLKNVGETIGKGAMALWNTLSGKTPKVLQDAVGAVPTAGAPRNIIQRILPHLVDPNDQNKLSKLGRGLAIGGTAAAGLGAGSMALKALRGGQPAVQNPTGPAGIPSPYPMQPPSGGGGMGGGGMSGGGMGGPMGGPSMGGASDPAMMQQLMGLASKVQEIDGRLTRIERGGR